MSPAVTQSSSRSRTPQLPNAKPPMHRGQVAHNLLNPKASEHEFHDRCSIVGSEWQRVRHRYYSESIGSGMAGMGRPLRRSGSRQTQLADSSGCSLLIQFRTRSRHCVARAAEPLCPLCRRRRSTRTSDHDSEAADAGLDANCCRAPAVANARQPRRRFARDGTFVRLTRRTSESRSEGKFCMKELPVFERITIVPSFAAAFARDLPF